MSVKLQCVDCERIINAPDDYDRNSVCKECQGELVDMSEESSEDSEEDSDTYECDNCGEDVDISDGAALFIRDSDDNLQYSFCDRCHSKACKNRGSVVVKEKVVERPVEKIVYVKVDENNNPIESDFENSRFD